MGLLETGIYAVLAADDAVKAIVITRIYPAMVPQGAVFPCLVYHQVAGEREHTMQGPNGLRQSRYQITAWGKMTDAAAAYAGAKALADAVRLALDGSYGTWSGVAVQGCSLMDETDVVEASPELETLRAVGVAQVYEIWSEESLT
jgi:hypothetical protein